MLQSYFRLRSYILRFLGRFRDGVALYHHRSRFRLLRWYECPLLGVSSPIGKELDSLADDITFGFAPSAIVFGYLSTFHIHLPFVPFLAFIMAAFSALRLAKFNLDERQALGFIGLPTPANALFCYLLIAEIPMFALKFKHWGFKGNEVKYIFVLSCIPLLLFLGVSGFAAIIAWYVLLSVITNKSN